MKISVPLIKAHAYFAIIEGHVFMHFSYIFKRKEKNKISILFFPLIKGDDPFAIIEGHVFMTICKKKEEPMFKTRTLLFETIT